MDTMGITLLTLFDIKEFDQQNCKNIRKIQKNIKKSDRTLSESFGENIIKKSIKC